MNATLFVSGALGSLPVYVVLCELIGRYPEPLSLVGLCVEFCSFALSMSYIKHVTRP